MPQEGGALLQQKLAAIGVSWHLGTSVASIAKNNGPLKVTLANGGRFDADLVLSAVGLRPRIALAQAAGIDTRLGAQRLVRPRYVVTATVTR